jgi:hypothetical protein
MDLLVFAIVVLIAVGIVAAIAYYIPWPPPLAWAKWAIPAIALVVALVVILERLGPLSHSP